MPYTAAATRLIHGRFQKHNSKTLCLTQEGALRFQIVFCHYIDRNTLGFEGYSMPKGGSHSECWVIRRVGPMPIHDEFVRMAAWREASGGLISVQL